MKSLNFPKFQHNTAVVTSLLLLWHHCGEIVAVFKTITAVQFRKIHRVTSVYYKIPVVLYVLSVVAFLWIWYDINGVWTGTQWASADTPGKTSKIPFSIKNILRNCFLPVSRTPLFVHLWLKLSCSDKKRARGRINAIHSFHIWMICLFSNVNSVVACVLLWWNRWGSFNLRCQ